MQNMNMALKWKELYSAFTKVSFHLWFLHCFPFLPHKQYFFLSLTNSSSISYIYEISYTFLLYK